MLALKVFRGGVESETVKLNVLGPGATIFGRLSVRIRILLLSAITVTGLVAVGICFWWSQERVEKSFQIAEDNAALAALVGELFERAEMMRIVEKDYLINPSVNDIRRFGEILAEARAQAAAIDQLAAAAAFQSQVRDVILTLDDVESAFIALHQVQSRIGFDSATGLRDTLAKTSGAVEGRLKKEARFSANPDLEKLARAVVEIQRAEKEFALDRTDVALGNFEVAFGRYERLIGKVAIPNDVKSEVVADMTTYRKTFDSFTAATSERETNVEHLEILFDLLPPNLEALKQAASAGSAAAKRELAAVRSLSTAVVGGVIVVVLALVAAVGLAIGRSIAVPLARLREAMEALAGGATEVDLPTAEGHNEIAAMAATVRVFRDNARERRNLAEAQAADNAARDARVARLEQLIGRFETTVEAVLGNLDEAGRDLADASAAVESASDNVASEAMRAGSAVRVAASNVTSAAAATEELATSITEIADQAAKSTGVAARAVTEARSTAETMTQLSSTANRISEVMSLIRTIANQTNLLALNATIEAARAGEHGRGFAIVAAEVKELAKETAQATEDIAIQVEAIQMASADAVTAIEEVGRIIEEMNGIATAVAASVEQQSAAVHAITENVANASGRADEGSGAMERVARATAHARSTGEAVRKMSSMLNEQARLIRQEVRVFLDEVRAA